MSITAPTLSISPEKVCFFIVKAHEYDIADSGANVADDGMIDPTFQELTAFINGLTEDEQVDLVALTWLGRGDGASVTGTICATKPCTTTAPPPICWETLCWAITSSKV